MRDVSLLAIAGLLLSSFAFTPPARAQEKPADKNSTPRYKDATLPVQDRVADLLPRLTLEEKVDQISGGWESKIGVVDPTGTYTTEKARQIVATIWGTDHTFTSREAAILRNGIQRYQMEKTKLGIPILFPGEGLHGLMEPGATSFPRHWVWPRHSIRRW